MSLGWICKQNCDIVCIGKRVRNMKNVDIIERLPKTKITKIAAYARVSSNSDDQIHSFKSQVAYYMEYINALSNAQMSGIYTDEGITGTSIIKRDGFKKMISDCESGKIDRIITKSISRFGRNFTETLMTLRKLKSLGVSVYFEKENIDTADTESEMSITMYAVHAEWESRNISYSQKWGFRTRAEKGIFNQPNLPYGYKRKDGSIIVDEEKSKIVRMLFDMFVNKDHSITYIEKFFNQNMIGDRKWTRSGILIMLSNERYCGDQLLQKKFSPDVFPYRLSPNKGELPQYYVYDSFPKIISRKLYEESNEKLQKIRARLNENQLMPNQKYLYTGKIECGECHKKFKRRMTEGKERWSCSQHLKDIEKCSVKEIRKREIDDAFLQIVSKLKNSNDILQEYGKQMRRILINGENKEELQKIEDELFKLDKEKLKILSDYAETTISETEKIKRVNAVQNYQFLYELEKQKLLNDIYQSGGIFENQRLLEILKDIEIEEKVDEDIFTTIVDKLVIDQDIIRFHLKNGLVLKVMRRKYHGNYSL